MPARLGGFLLLNLLGKGGMGAVYEAKDESLNRLVAIKVMLRSLSHDKKFVETFRQEAQAAAALNHPNIVQIHSFGEERGQLYIVMELLRGGCLDAMIAGGKSLAVSRVLQIGVEVAEGLKAADDIGLRHGDIKPENILMDNSGVSKVVDFGLASFRDKAAERTDVWGTPYYIAPEKAKGRRADAKSDIYSLGATLYHALAGKPPFDGETALDVVKARLEKEPPKLSDLRPGISAEVDGIISRMLQPDPALRYPTYASLIADMRKALGGETPAGGGPTAPPMRRGGKIVLKKKGGGTTVMRAGPGPAGGRSLGSVPDRAASAKDRLLSADGKPRKRRKRSPVGAVVAVVVLFCLAAAAAVGYWQYAKYRARQEAEAAERAALKRAREAVEAAFSGLEARATNAVAKAGAASGLIEQAVDTWEWLRTAVDDTNAWTDLAGALSTNGVEFRATNAAALAESRAAAIKAVVWSARETNMVAGTLRLSKAVEAAAATLKPLSTQLEALVRSVDEVGTLGEALQRDVLGVSNRWALAKAAAEAEAARIAAAEADAERRAAEEAERERREEQHRLLVEQELAAVESGKEGAREHVRTYDFAAAVSALAEVAGDLQSDEGKQAFSAVTNRYGRLGQLKTFLVDQIHQTPYPWGWNGVADVVDADEEGVSLANRKVPWRGVSPTQMLRFVNYYREKAKVSRAERARVTLAAAVFCYELGAGKLAAEFVDKATALDAELQAESARLMPDLDERASER